MKKLLLLMPFALAGCATNYEGYVEANVKIAEAKARADTEKYKAMAAIASTGDAAAKVAAVMSMALGQPNQQNQQQITPPNTNAAAASVANTQSTSAAFINIAGKIQAPAANVTTTYNPTQVVTQEKVVVVKPEVIKIEPFVVDPTIVEPKVVNPVVVNPVIVNPTTIPPSK
ncbi:MAG: hypothetical protein EBR82_56710 [Caulobacteraceae bacterium]|nr:hypothetical protein [Caulobacteraceae bacterium]